MSRVLDNLRSPLLALVLCAGGCVSAFNASDSMLGHMLAASNGESRARAGSSSAEKEPSEGSSGQARSGAENVEQRSTDSSKNGAGVRSNDEAGSEAPQSARREVPDRDAAEAEIAAVLKYYEGVLPPQALREMADGLRQIDPRDLPAMLKIHRSVAQLACLARQPASRPNDMQPPDPAEFTAPQPDAGPRGRPATRSTGDGAPPPKFPRSSHDVNAAREVAANDEDQPPAHKPRSARGIRLPASPVPAESPFEDEAQRHLLAAIELLEDELPRAADTAQAARWHATLRLLYLLAQHKDDALRPIPGASPELQEFWQKQLSGLAAMLDARPNHPARRANDASRHLRDAARKAGEMGQLDLRNVAFCTKVQGYGQVERFKSQNYQPGDQVLLYAELENFKSERRDEGYVVSLRARYTVEDDDGQVVDERSLGDIQDVCQNIRRDFFISYKLRLPEKLSDGTYRLVLTVEDVLNEKVATATAEFRIKQR